MIISIYYHQQWQWQWQWQCQINRCSYLDVHMLVLILVLFDANQFIDTKTPTSHYYHSNSLIVSHHPCIQGNNVSIAHPCRLQHLHPLSSKFVSFYNC